MGRDSFLGTLLVALVLCVTCSVLVSAAAVLLNERQVKNKLLYEKTQILKAAGLIGEQAATDSPGESQEEEKPAPSKAPSNEEIEEIFSKRVRKVLVNLEEGTIVPNEEVDYEEYNPRDAADDPEKSKEIEEGAGPTPGVDRRPKLQFAYEVMAPGSEDDVVQYVLPIYGKGLWSTLYGFLAIDADGQTIRGITFYEHGETPGLGGEVENPGWQAKWDGKKAYEGDDVVIEVVKGQASGDSEIDGLSGATITTKGVSNFVQYWLGPEGFKTFLDKQTAS